MNKSSDSIFNSGHEHIITADGSSTILLSGLNEQYHSVNGAIQESTIVYIENGLNYYKKNAVNILEVGFGTGLNCLLTIVANTSGLSVKTINYTALEPFPVNKNLLQQLNYVALLSATNVKQAFDDMHALPSFQNKEIAAHFYLNKSLSSIQDFASANEHFDMIYFDAFGPAVQPEMWTKPIFDKLYSMLKSGGILLTYCAKGEVKRTLKAAGFKIESLPGPPGKREITRATK